MGKGQGQGSSAPVNSGLSVEQEIKKKLNEKTAAPDPTKEIEEEFPETLAPWPGIKGVVFWLHAFMFPHLHPSFVHGMDIPFPQQNTPRSMTAWFRISDTKSLDHFIAGYGGVDTHQKFSLAVSDSGFLEVDTNMSLYFGEKRVDDGEWHMAALVFDGRFMTLFVDAQVDNTWDHVPLETKGYSMVVGGHSEEMDLQFGGDIGDVALYDGPLTVAEVQALFKAGFNDRHGGGTLRRPKYKKHMRKYLRSVITTHVHKLPEKLFNKFTVGLAEALKKKQSAFVFAATADQSQPLVEGQSQSNIPAPVDSKTAVAPDDEIESMIRQVGPYTMGSLYEETLKGTIPGPYDAFDGPRKAPETVTNETKEEEGGEGASSSSAQPLEASQPDDDFMVDPHSLEKNPIDKFANDATQPADEKQIQDEKQGDVSSSPSTTNATSNVGEDQPSAVAQQPTDATPKDDSPVHQPTSEDQQSAIVTPQEIQTESQPTVTTTTATATDESAGQIKDDEEGKGSPRSTSGSSPRGSPPISALDEIDKEPPLLEIYIPKEGERRPLKRFEIAMSVDPDYFEAPTPPSTPSSGPAARVSTPTSDVELTKNDTDQQKPVKVRKIFGHKTIEEDSINQSEGMTGGNGGRKLETPEEKVPTSVVHGNEEKKEKTTSNEPQIQQQPQQTQPQEKSPKSEKEKQEEEKEDSEWTKVDMDEAIKTGDEIITKIIEKQEHKKQENEHKPPSTSSPSKPHQPSAPAQPTSPAAPATTSDTKPQPDTQQQSSAHADSASQEHTIAQTKPAEQQQAAKWSLLGWLTGKNGQPTPAPKPEELPADQPKPTDTKQPSQPQQANTNVQQQPAQTAAATTSSQPQTSSTTTTAAVVNKKPKKHKSKKSGRRSPKNQQKATKTVSDKQAGSSSSSGETSTSADESGSQEGDIEIKEHVSDGEQPTKESAETPANPQSSENVKHSATSTQPATQPATSTVTKPTATPAQQPSGGVRSEASNDQQTPAATNNAQPGETKPAQTSSTKPTAPKPKAVKSKQPKNEKEREGESSGDESHEGDIVITEHVDIDGENIAKDQVDIQVHVSENLENQNAPISAIVKPINDQPQQQTENQPTVQKDESKSVGDLDIRSVIDTVHNLVEKQTEKEESSSESESETGSHEGDIVITEHVGDDASGVQMSQQEESEYSSSSLPTESENDDIGSSESSTEEVDLSMNSTNIRSPTDSITPEESLGTASAHTKPSTPSKDTTPSPRAPSGPTSQQVQSQTQTANSIPTKDQLAVGSTAPGSTTPAAPKTESKSPKDKKKKGKKSKAVPAQDGQSTPTPQHQGGSSTSSTTTPKKDDPSSGVAASTKKVKKEKPKPKPKKSQQPSSTTPSIQDAVKAAENLEKKKKGDRKKEHDSGDESGSQEGDIEITVRDDEQPEPSKPTTTKDSISLPSAQNQTGPSTNDEEVVLDTEENARPIPGVLPQPSPALQDEARSDSESSDTFAPISAIEQLDEIEEDVLLPTPAMPTPTQPVSTISPTPQPTVSSTQPVPSLDAPKQPIVPSNKPQDLTKAVEPAQPVSPAGLNEHLSQTPSADAPKVEPADVPSGKPKDSNSEEQTQAVSQSPSAPVNQLQAANTSAVDAPPSEPAVPSAKPKDTTEAEDPAQEPTTPSKPAVTQAPTDSSKKQTPQRKPPLIEYVESVVEEVDKVLAKKDEGNEDDESGSQEGDIEITEHVSEDEHVEGITQASTTPTQTSQDTPAPISPSAPVEPANDQSQQPAAAVTATSTSAQTTPPQVTEQPDSEDESGSQEGNIEITVRDGDLVDQTEGPAKPAVVETSPSTNPDEEVVLDTKADAKPIPGVLPPHKTEKSDSNGKDLVPEQQAAVSDSDETGSQEGDIEINVREDEDKPQPTSVSTEDTPKSPETVTQPMSQEAPSQPDPLPQTPKTAPVEEIQEDSEDESGSQEGDIEIKVRDDEVVSSEHVATQPEQTNSTQPIPTQSSTSSSPQPISTPQVAEETPELNTPTPGVPTDFKWTGEGKTVFVTGTFTEWKNHISLEWQHDHFHVRINIAVGRHFFKFIVDGEWKCDIALPTATDEQGNANNVIEVKAEPQADAPVPAQSTTSASSPSASQQPSAPETHAPSSKNKKKKAAASEKAETRVESEVESDGSHEGDIEIKIHEESNTPQQQISETLSQPTPAQASVDEPKSAESELVPTESQQTSEQKQPETPSASQTEQNSQPSTSDQQEPVSMPHQTEKEEESDSGSEEGDIEITVRDDEPIIPQDSTPSTTDQLPSDAQQVAAQSQQPSPVKTQDQKPEQAPVSEKKDDQGNDSEETGSQEGDIEINVREDDTTQQPVVTPSNTAVESQNETPEQPSEPSVSLEKEPASTPQQTEKEEESGSEEGDIEITVRSDEPVIPQDSATEQPSSEAQQIAAQPPQPSPAETQEPEQASSTLGEKKDDQSNDNEETGSQEGDIEINVREDDTTQAQQPVVTPSNPSVAPQNKTPAPSTTPAEPTTNPAVHQPKEDSGDESGSQEGDIEIKVRDDEVAEETKPVAPAAPTPKDKKKKNRNHKKGKQSTAASVSQPATPAEPKVESDADETGSHEGDIEITVHEDSQPTKPSSTKKEKKQKKGKKIDSSNSSSSSSSSESESDSGSHEGDIEISVREDDVVEKPQEVAKTSDASSSTQQHEETKPRGKGKRGKGQQPAKPTSSQPEPVTQPSSQPAQTHVKEQQAQAKSETPITPQPTEPHSAPSATKSEQPETVPETQSKQPEKPHATSPDQKPTGRGQKATKGTKQTPATTTPSAPEVATSPSAEATQPQPTPSSVPTPKKEQDTTPAPTLSPVEQPKPQTTQTPEATSETAVGESKPQPTTPTPAEKSPEQQQQPNGEKKDGEIEAPATPKDPSEEGSTKDEKKPAENVSVEVAATATALKSAIAQSLETAKEGIKEHVESGETGGDVSGAQSKKSKKKEKAAAAASAALPTLEDDKPRFRVMCVAAPTKKAMVKRSVLRFSGGECLRIGNPAALLPSSSFTIEAWIKPTPYVTVNVCAIVNFGSANKRTPEIFLRSFGGNWQAGCCPPKNRLAFSKIRDTDQWIHLACVYDMTETRMSLYIDGELRNEDRTVAIPFAKFKSPVEPLDGWAIGAQGDCADRFYKGLMCEVKIWEYPRTQEEIQSTKFVSLTGREPGLAAYWPMDDASGSIVRDLGPHQAHGSFVGSLSWPNISDGPCAPGALDISSL